MNEIIIPVQFLVETSLDRLYTDTVNGFETPRRQNAGRVQVVNKIYVAAPLNNSVGVRAQTRSSANTYDARMFFEGVEYLNADEAEDVEDAQDAEDTEQEPEVEPEVETPPDSFAFKASDGQDYVIVPVGYSNNDVKVSCSCLDFYYRFSVWNNRDGSLFGRPPPPYVNKTDNGKPVNPDRIAGLCKHLIALTDDLKRERFLR